MPVYFLFMEAHIELEYKVMIDEGIYCKMLDFYHLVPVKQVNYYYSTNKPFHAMRIREREGHFIFTLKVKENNYHREYEFEIANNDICDPKVEELLNMFHIRKAEYIGSMTTYRAVLDFEKGELCIDKSEYLDKTDYEIEYELKDAKIDDFSTFESVLANFGIKYSPSQKSKFKRFIDALEEKR